MIAAIYARKSTDQTGVHDETKSVVRQVDHAKAYAKSKGWTVIEEHVYVDDGISGAEFIKRPGFLRLMNVLKPHPPFQVLIMSEESRLGREAIKTAYALQQLMEAGVRVFFYLEDRERTLDTPTDKIMLSLTAFADELEREKARQRTRDAMLRKARAGHVTGGKVFGYHNVEVASGLPDGQGRPRRDHVEYRINEPEAAAVRRIFTLCAEGKGLCRIAKALNAEGLPAPRATKGWAPSSVRVVLYRRLYVGELIWGKTPKHNKAGGRAGTRKPSSEWERVAVPQLRLITDDLWAAAHARLAQTRHSYLTATKGQLWGRPDSGLDSKYMLTGLGQCGECGGSLYVRSSRWGTASARRLFYACQAYQLRGTRACTNKMLVPMEQLNTQLLECLEEDILQPAILVSAVRQAVARLRPDDNALAARRVALTAELATVQSELGRYAEAIASAGPVPALLTAIHTREQRREALERELASLEGLARLSDVDEARLVEDLEAHLLMHWRGLLTKHVSVTRQLLRKLLTERVQIARHGAEAYVFSGKATVGRLLSGALPKVMVSPTGGVDFARYNDRLREHRSTLRGETVAFYSPLSC